MKSKNNTVKFFVAIIVFSIAFGCVSGCNPKGKDGPSDEEKKAIAEFQKRSIDSLEKALNKK
jgi:hypothetical protein